MHSHYVRDLAGLHIEHDQYTEAGLTLLLTASRYTWSDDPLPGNVDPLRQWQRKENLYLEIIQYLDTGKVPFTDKRFHPLSLLSTFHFSPLPILYLSLHPLSLLYTSHVSLSPYSLPSISSSIYPFSLSLTLSSLYPFFFSLSLSLCSLNRGAVMLNAL